MSKKKKKSRKRRPKPKSQAARADRHALYQQSVQGPEHDVELFDRIYREIRGRRPLSLREDFCGTAFLSTVWAKSHRNRTAVGIDFDRPTLDWGEAHNLAPADPDVRKRVRLIEADVREASAPRCDITCAMNFSHWVFKTRAELRQYFDAAYAGLKDDGVFVTELYGGTEAIVEISEKRDAEGVELVWEQSWFNPINHDILCHIHYRFPDGSKLKRAFTYDWRLWSIPETRELLAQSGFARSHVYWDPVDDDGDGTGRYRRTEEEENQETWLVCVVAEK